MQEVLLGYLNKAIEFEGKGCPDEAVVLYDKLLEVFPESLETILMEKAKLEFRNMRDRDALMDFIRAYAVDRNEEIYHLILEAYLCPNMEELQKRYQENLQRLRQYSFYKNEFDTEQLDLYVLWIDEEVICFVNETERAFGVLPYTPYQELERKETPLMVINDLWVKNIQYYRGQAKKKEAFLDMEIPFYLQYDRNYWMLFAQVQSMDQLISENRTVFLIGEKSIYEYFEDASTILPQQLIGTGTNINYRKIINEISARNNQELKRYTEENKQYYQNAGRQIVQNIKRGKPRILFFTSRFTTILQYHTRDCRQAAQRLGCETELLIEADGIHRVSALECQKYIRDFKPDIIFCIDHFRFEQYMIPEEIIWIAWAQDPLTYVMDRKTPSKLTNRDFVLNHFTTWKQFKEIGYEEDILMDAPIPANSGIYRPYPLNGQEKEQYACDICFVCHASDAQGHIDKVACSFPQELGEAVRAVYEGYQNFVYNTGELFYGEDVFAEYIKGAMSQHFGISLQNQTLGYLANDMCMWFNQRVFRQVLVDWILEAGFTDIKLWGNGWKNCPKYEKYAMGPAENGETLSKIYQASRVVIGNNILTTSAARAWETMLSGGFYMSNYIPPESDITDIRKIVEVDKDVVMFYNKEDLIRKLHYYLEHEEERRRMIDRGRKAALEKMTFDKLMERTLGEVAARLEA